MPRQKSGRANKNAINVRTERSEQFLCRRFFQIFLKIVPIFCYSVLVMAINRQLTKDIFDAVASCFIELLMSNWL